MINGPLLALVLAGAVAVFAGQQVAHGAKRVAHGAKVVAVKTAHVVRKAV